jgi:hypothetical protein
LGIGVPKRKFNAVNPISITLDSSLVSHYSGKAIGIFEEHSKANSSVETCCKGASISVNEHQDSATNIPIGRSGVTVFDNREINIP